jgi:predicted nucleic acid-binding protein
VNLFLDANVALAACGRPVGASRAIFDVAPQNGWKLMTSGYALAEVSVNLPRLGPIATQEWARLRRQLLTVRDVWTLDRPVIFSPAKDRPVLFTAAAWAQVLLTLDRRDFGAVMGGRFYGLDVLTPGDFLERERSGGRLK